jgi:hypothetical protein
MNENIEGKLRGTWRRLTALWSISPVAAHIHDRSVELRLASRSNFSYV